MTTAFVPFGDFVPDRRYLGNTSGGLLMAREVVPVYGSYIASPDTPALGQIATSAAERGLHVHLATGDGYVAVDVGGVARLYQITEPLGVPPVITDRSKAGAYTQGFEWYGCSFGSNVVMANGDSPVQYRDAGGAAAFANMITSTFAPVGKFPFAFKNNLFLANLTLAAPYDGLAAGANPTVVAWSGSDNIRQFGSFNADPQIIGAGYQPLNFDIGDITGAIGGTDYALVAHSNGFVRIEGPPYTFKVVTDGCGCLYPYSLCRVRDDVYFWGPSGLTRLRGGLGPPETVGIGKFTRSLIDNTTGFSDISWINGGQIISSAYDALNDIVLTAYRSNLETTTGVSDPHAQTFLWYNVNEDRATVATMPRYDLDDAVAPAHYLRTGRQAGVGSYWTPARDIRFLSNSANTTAGTVSYHYFSLGGIPQSLILHGGYNRLNPETTSRIVRVRPVYTKTDNSVVVGVWSATIESTNMAHSTPATSGPFTTADSHGWITTPTAVMGDFHSVSFNLSPATDVYKIAEFRGYEVEFVSGGKYGA